MRPTVVAVIPARLQSSRFPGKALHPIHGRPLLYHVWKSVCRCKTIDKVLIATESQEIIKAAHDFGAEVFRSSSKPKTGSDRVAEVAREVRADIYTNIQGDCFGISSTAIDKVVALVAKDKKLPLALLPLR